MFFQKKVNVSLCWMQTLKKHSLCITLINTAP